MDFSSPPARWARLARCFTKTSGEFPLDPLARMERLLLRVQFADAIEEQLWPLQTVNRPSAQVGGIADEYEQLAPGAEDPA